MLLSLGTLKEHSFFYFVLYRLHTVHVKKTLLGNLFCYCFYRNDDLTVFLKQIDELQNGSSAEHQDAYNLLINKTNQVYLGLGTFLEVVLNFRNCKKDDQSILFLDISP